MRNTFAVHRPRPSAAALRRNLPRNVAGILLFELTWGLGIPMGLFASMAPAYLNALGSSKSLIGPGERPLDLPRPSPAPGEPAVDREAARAHVVDAVHRGNGHPAGLRRVCRLRAGPLDARELRGVFRPRLHRLHRSLRHRPDDLHGHRDRQCPRAAQGLALRPAHALHGGRRDRHGLPGLLGPSPVGEPLQLPGELPDRRQHLDPFHGFLPSLEGQAP